MAFVHTTADKRRSATIKAHQGSKSGNVIRYTPITRDLQEQLTINSSNVLLKKSMQDEPTFLPGTGRFL